MTVLKRGDIIMLNFNPSSGYEQKGYRPALVFSPEVFNDKTPFVIVCPITSKRKGNIFEVELSKDINSCGVDGAILVHHIKSVDIKSRQRDYKIVGEAPKKCLQEVMNKLKPLLT
ncbi:type II toxin-antitoxin system PemK/MazF family toxin [Alkalihalobacillus pseudalcaliphilus]|uniref:type II toxin-antitoxin system PemK/MazF family toxin n=1 Tax=Alkalihalobacillus pseudalcaliphilus TaxID=79884 RepID=UPI000A6C6EEC|nr:type II toxin-antitoxin system PemK/MazF family toxin [Alkalihalobacillus pseudalcaliphilus]